MTSTGDQGINAEVRAAFVRHLTQVVAMLEARFPHMRGRSSRINAACTGFAERLGFSDLQKASLSLVARFHDVGMLGVPDALVTANRALSPQERAIIDRHTDVGGRIVFTLFPDLPDVAEGIWFHHERPDGRGPHKLVAGEIPAFARIVGLIQAVEAMANGRSHKRSCSLTEIVAEVKKGCGSQFDSAVADLFVQRAEPLFKLLLNAHPVDPSKVSGVGGEQGSGTSPVPPPTSVPDTSPAATAASIANLKPIIRREELAKLVTEGLNLRPLAVAAQNVLTVSASSECTSEDVAEAVGRDQTLAVRLLKLANSAAYNRGKQVKDVKEAVQRIGIRDVRNLVMTLSVVKNYQGRIAKYLDPFLFWEHSIAVGVAARHLGMAVSSQHAERCFLWGVLHDVGRLVLADHVPDHYFHVWDAAESLGLPLETVEGAMVLLDHAHILQRAMEHWKFPKDLIVPVVNHEKTLAKLVRLGPEHMESAVLIALANRLVHALLLGSSGNDVIYPAEDFAQKVGLGPTDIESRIESIRDETAAVKVAMLARSDLDQFPDFARKMRKLLKADVRVVSAGSANVFDTFRVFFESLRGNNQEDAPANLGLLYVPDMRQFANAIACYEKAESQAGVSNLPVLVVFARGKVNDNDAWLRSRGHRAVRAPVPVRTLIRLANELLVKTPTPVPA